VNCGGGFQGLAVVQCLRAIPDVRIILSDINLQHVTQGLVDRVLHAPPLCEEEAFLDHIESICREESVTLVVPATAHELMVLAAHRVRIEETGARVAVPGHSLLKTVLDKATCDEWLASRGHHPIPTADPTAADCPWPIRVKPRCGWGGREHQVLVDAAAWHQWAADHDTSQWRVQPELSGWTEYSADFGVSESGQSGPVLLRLRLHVTGGFATVGKVAADPQAQNLAEQLAADLSQAGGFGAWNVQMMRWGDDLYVSDVNPRLGTSAPISLAVGHNPLLPVLGLSATKTTCPSVLVRRRLVETIVLPPVDVALKAVVFDLDDTLIDHKKWMIGKLEAVADRFAGEQRDAFMLAGLEFIDQGPLPTLIDAMIERLGWTSADRDGMIECWRDARSAADPCFFEARPVLRELHRRGYRLGILTDNPPVSQQQKIDATGLDSLVDAVVFTRDAGREKPSSEGFRRICDVLEVSPSETMMVGDDLFRDVVGAHRAGFAAITLLTRPGTCRSGSPAVADAAAGLAGSYARVCDLREMLEGLGSDQFAASGNETAGGVYTPPAAGGT
jgi:HAD superfamily hydrolase (TIGR01662 family)